MLAVTSGTTGKSCLIPKTIDNSRAFVEFGFSVGVYHSIFNALPKVRQLLKRKQRLAMKNITFLEHIKFKYRKLFSFTRLTCVLMGVTALGQSHT